MIFEHVAPTKGWPTLGQFVRTSEEEQEYIYDTVLDGWRANVEAVNKTLDEWHPRVREVGVRPFATHSSPPNVFAPFHLIAQSLMEEFVWSALSLLIV